MNQEICKHKKYYHQCLACAMEDISIRNQMRDWKKEFEVSQIMSSYIDIPKKNRLKK